MTHERPMSVVAIIALALASGAAVGLLVGRLWAQQIDLRARRSFHALASTVQRRHNPEQWARDSAARERLFHAFPHESPPRELRREQIVSDCLVTFQLPDTTLANWIMFTVYARDTRGALLGRASAYADQGFGPGDRVSVVVSDVQCAAVAGFGLSSLPAAPAPPLHWAEPQPEPRPSPRPS
jgi:hypothetical protein